MLRKVFQFPEVVAHYSVGSVLLVGHLVIVGFQLRKQAGAKP